MRLNPKQLLFWCCAFAFVGGFTFFLQYVWREQGLRSLQALSTQRIQLLATAIDAEINRQDHLPLLLALDYDIRAALASPIDPTRTEELNRKLRRISLEADTRAIYVVRPDGSVLASDDLDGATAISGRNVADRAYFRHALKRGKTTELALDPETKRVRYWLAEPVRNDALTPLGVVVVRVEFDALEESWGRAGERIIVTDQSGIAFLASDPVYKFRVMDLKGESRPIRSPMPDYYQADPGPRISWTLLEQRSNASIIRAQNSADGSTYLYESVPLPQHGWTVHLLASLDTVASDQRDGAIIGATISTLLILLLLYTRQRHRAYVSAREAGKQLMREVAERTRELRETNKSLRTEVDERRRAEAQLRSTQNELVQAGKLAALGQMSATLAHEINQPLAAIRTFIASAKIFSNRGDLSQVSGNLDLISNLAERMARLTAHLKTFARKSEPGHRERVQVDRAVEGALFLVESRIKSAAVKVEKEIEHNLLVIGHAVQLEQVIVNLLLNALDAVVDVKEPTIQIVVRSSGNNVVIAVLDNGPGIPVDMMERMFDPFVTTKAVGKGLGLGLSISYGIVQDFHGRIFAANRPEGGAEVTVELPRLSQEMPVMTETSHA